MFRSLISKAGAFAQGFGLERKSLTYSIADPATWPDFYPAASGVSVTPETALNCTAVNCAVRVISEAIGQLPLLVYERKADGSKERATSHASYRLLHDVSNDWTTAPALKVQIMRDAMLHGSGYAWIDRSSLGIPIALSRLDPKLVTVQRDGFTGEPSYFLSTANGRRPIDRRDILHIQAPGGESLIHRGREAIGLAIAMEQFAGRLFANNAQPAGVISFPEKFKGGVEELRKAQAAWKRDVGAGSVPVLDAGGKFEAFAFKSTDMQFLEQLNRNTIEICRLFRVPPQKLYELARSTYNNIEHMGSDFVDFSLAYWLEAWQGEVALKLFSDEERSSFYAEFLLDGLLKADTAARYEAYSKAIASRFMNPNEVRQRENLPPYPGGDTFANPNTSSGAQPAPSNDNSNPSKAAA